MTVDGFIVTLHADGVTSFADLNAFVQTGEFVVSFAGVGRTASAFVASMPDEPVPMLRTTWVTSQNVTHEVVTPIASTTEAGLARAVAIHDRLVSMQQAKHPPAPQP